MNANAFYDQWANLVDYFGMKVNDFQRQQYYKALLYATVEAFKHAAEAVIRTKKPTRANFPTIEELQALCPKSESPMRYNPDETEEQYWRRITVKHLWEATKLYQEKGKDAALEYMHRLHFSADDIEAVEFKANGAYRVVPKVGKDFPKIDHSARLEELRQQAQQLGAEIPF